MKGLMILADGFEDTEALMTRDILKRAGIDIITASPNLNLRTISAYALEVYADRNLTKLSADDFDFLVIPGGRAVELVLKKNKEVEKLVLSFAKQEKLIAAICAAPSLLIQYGLLEDIEYTCFPTCEDTKAAPLYSKDKGVVVTKNIISAKAMAYTMDFSLAIITKLLGENKARQVLAATKGE